MSTAKSTLTPAKATPVPAAAPSGVIGAWVKFWFAAVDPVGLHALRVLGGLLFLLWLLPLAGNQEALFGLGGWFDARAYREASRLSMLPPHTFGWSVVYLAGDNSAALTAIYWLSVIAVVLFTAGIATRVTGVLTWVAVVSYTANPALAYDADPLLVMLAFYLMTGYLLLGQWHSGPSLLERLLGPRDTWLFRRGRADAPAESVGANLAVRLFQVHFAIAMVATGLHKLQVKEWWAGVAPWFYLNPPFQASAASLQSWATSGGSWLVVFSLAAYAVLAWQIGFPAFAWRRSLRVVLLGGAALAWLACTFWVSLPLFGPLMVVACLGYLSPAEWRRIQDLLTRLPGLRQLLGRLSRAPEGSALAGPKGVTVARASAVSVGQR
jgi:hypothetical protein